MLGTDLGDRLSDARATYVRRRGNKNGDLLAFLGSPLTDSNRRPPPYHGGFRFRGVVRRIVLAEPFPRYFRDSSAARPLLGTALNLPDRPRTCPQNLAPDV